MLLAKEIDASLVNAAWKRTVLANPDLTAGAVNRDAYVVCVLEALFRALQVRDVFAVPSLRWADPRAHLLDGAAWEAISEDALASLSRPALKRGRRDRMIFATTKACPGVLPGDGPFAGSAAERARTPDLLIRREVQTSCQRVPTLVKR
ncbi:hypothetical protein [Nonomuraea jabiensis]|uniref:hypothetical protein n=1 Tax=Nonomuraea jabiensis TaxID=882448 RepID=UPI0036B5FE54